ncbi:squalene--hopene cyclase [Dactylosporangium sp. NPDC005572]|uniref:squalene--hopene cyclase n=1 Tax=Dactylosporangium sp. NPDC005572 TaxID=3156889 RepID=UPI00339DAE9B
MVDLDAAIGYVVAHGDAVDRARLAHLRTGQAPPADVLDKAEIGQVTGGGWPAYWGADIPSVDATCFRLAELDDLGAIGRPAARKAVGWLGRSQRPDGMWEEDAKLAGIAPPWAQPGDAEARLYLTTNAAYWLVVGGPPDGDDGEHATRIARAAEAFRASLRPDGSWPSFLVTGWLGCALLYHLGWFYESAQIQVALADRVPEMTAADTASLFSTLRRIGMSTEDWLLTAARRRLAETQRSDGGWESDDGDQFNVHTTLTAIRALR